MSDAASTSDTMSCEKGINVVDKMVNKEKPVEEFSRPVVFETKMVFRGEKSEISNQKLRADSDIRILSDTRLAGSFTTYHRVPASSLSNKKISVIPLPAKYSSVPKTNMPYSNCSKIPSTSSSSGPVLFPVKRLWQERPRKITKVEEDEASSELVETIKQKILSDTAKRQAEAEANMPIRDKPKPEREKPHTSSTVCEFLDQRTNSNCKQRAILCYKFCIRHILTDPTAPYIQCEHLCRPRNKKSATTRCTNAIRNDTGEVFCSTHLIMYGMKDVKKKKQNTTENEDHTSQPNLLKSGVVTAVYMPSNNSPPTPTPVSMLKTTLSEPPLPPIQIPQLPSFGQNSYCSPSESKRPVFEVSRVLSSEQAVTHQTASSNEFIRNSKTSLRPVSFVQNKIPLIHGNNVDIQTKTSDSRRESVKETVPTHLIPDGKVAHNVQKTSDLLITPCTPDRNLSTIDSIIEEVRLAARRSIQARSKEATNVRATCAMDNIDSKNASQSSEELKRFPVIQLPNNVSFTLNESNNTSSKTKYSRPTSPLLNCLPIEHQVVKEQIPSMNYSDCVLVKMTEKLKPEMVRVSKDKNIESLLSKPMKKRSPEERKLKRKRVKRVPTLMTKIGRILKEITTVSQLSIEFSVGAEIAQRMRDGKSLISPDIIEKVQNNVVKYNYSDCENFKNEYEYEYMAQGVSLSEDIVDKEPSIEECILVLDCNSDECKKNLLSKSDRKRKIYQYSYEKLANLMGKVTTLCNEVNDSNVPKKVQARMGKLEDVYVDPQLSFDDLRKCHHIENNIRCNKKCLPYANHCNNHVLYSVSQRLFSFCTHTCCRRPVVAVDVVVWDGKCRLHRTTLDEKYDSDGELKDKPNETSTSLNELYGKGNFERREACNKHISDRVVPKIPTASSATSRRTDSLPLRKDVITNRTALDDYFIDNLDVAYGVQDVAMNTNFESTKDDNIYTDDDGEVAELLKFLDDDNEDLGPFSMEIED